MLLCPALFFLVSALCQPSHGLINSFQTKEADTDIQRDDDGTLHVEADYKVADEDEDEGEGGDENIIELSDGDEV